MKKTSTSSNQIPAWQTERSENLHRICKRVQARIGRGEKMKRAIRLFSRRWNGKPLKTDPARTFALSPGTLDRLYRAWRLGGETVDAFKLNYYPGRRGVSAAVLIRFVNFAASHPFPSFRAAWEAFCKRGRAAGPGRVRQEPLKLGLDALWWNLPRGFWRDLKRSHRALAAAEFEKHQLRLKTIAEIEAKSPARLPRQKPGDFRI
jgi:hypothetical protein